MRILVVNWMDRENPQAGGAEIHLHETFGRLAARGHTVSLLCSGWEGAPPRAELDGIRVHRTGSRYTFPLRAWPYYRRYLAQGPADAAGGSERGPRDAAARERRPWDVLVEDLNKVPLFTPAWGDVPVVPLVHHLFGATAFQEASFPIAALTVALEWPLARAFQGRPTVAVSPSTAEDLVRRGFRAEDVSVIPNGIDLDWYAPDAGVSRFPEPSLLFLGRLKRYKRVDLVLQALAALRAEGLSGVRLRVGGRGDDLPRLEARAAALGVADAVDFLGFVSEEEKRSLLRRSWVHVLTSSKEGWGITVMEAAACGTPTVASDAPGLRDSVRHGRTGLLVPHDDVPALTRALHGVLTDAHLRDELGRGARDFAAGFGWDHTARAMEGVLERAGRGGGAGAGRRDVTDEAPRNGPGSLALPPGGR
jgi:glycosyltransferase involved in cell wall biosynthesis